MIRLPVVALLTLGCPAAAVAAGNLVLNPGFDADLNDWTPVTSAGASVSRDASFGNPAGSVYASAPLPNTSAAITQCIGISAPFIADFSVDGYASAASVSGGWVLAATAYDAVGCAGNDLGVLPQVDYSFPPSSWHGFTVIFAGALPAGTQSVLLTVGCEALAAAGSSDNYYFDNVWFGDDRLFADGFGS